MLKHSTRILIPVLLFVMLMLPIQTAYAATFTVTTSVDELDGNCATDNQATLSAGNGLSLREVICLANQNPDADIIQLTGGTTYDITINGPGEDLAATGDLDIVDNAGAAPDVTLTVSGAGTAIIDAGPAFNDRVFHILDGASLTIQNGSTVQGNGVCTDGGGLYNVSGGTTTITGSILNGNGATNSGGGIWTDGANGLTVNGGSIIGLAAAPNVSNSAGGGIWVEGGSASVTDSTVQYNTAANAGGGIYVNAGTLTLTATTLSNNSANGGDGGGIFNNDIIDAITNSTISGNQAISNGGGIHNAGTITTITGTIITGNTAANAGGGINVESGATVTIEDGSVISDNTATNSRGGGISTNGTVDVIDSTISDNRALDSQGGGLNIGNGSLDVIRSTISGNYASASGGGILISLGTVGITNSTISGNTSDSAGGALNHSAGGVTITNSTISGNSAQAFGDGIRTILVIGSMSISNTIIADHANGNCSVTAGSITDNGNNLADDATCGFGAGDNAITPGVDYDTTLANNGGPTLTHALLPGSVALENAGACGLATDQRGVSRPINTDCDTGAYEFVLPVVATFTCNGTDLVAEVLDGNFNMTVYVTSPELNNQSNGFNSVGSTTFTSAQYGTWTNIYVEDTNGVIWPFDDVVCHARSAPSPPAAPVIAEGDPAIVKYASVDQALAGETVIWTVEIWNPGSTPTANNVYMRDFMPDAFLVTDVSVQGNAMLVSDDQSIEVSIGTLQPGEKIIITITTIAQDGVQGEVCNTVEATYAGVPNATDCVILNYPDELPPTGGHPVDERQMIIRFALITLLGAVIGLGLAGKVIGIKRRT